MVVSVSREANLTLCFVLIINLVNFLTFEAQSLSMLALQAGSIVSWFALSKVQSLAPWYAKIANIWFRLRVVIRIIIVVIVIYGMITNRLCRMIASGFYSFRGITYFSQHRFRVKMFQKSVAKLDRSSKQMDQSNEQVFPLSSTPKAEPTSADDVYQYPSSVSSVNKRLFAEQEVSNQRPEVASFRRSSLINQPMFSSTKYDGASKPASVTSSLATYITSPFLSHRSSTPLPVADNVIHSHMNRAGQLSYSSQNEKPIESSILSFFASPSASRGASSAIKRKLPAAERTVDRKRQHMSEGIEEQFVPLRECVGRDTSSADTANYYAKKNSVRFAADVVDASSPLNEGDKRDERETVFEQNKSKRVENGFNAKSLHESPLEPHHRDSTDEKLEKEVGDVDSYNVDEYSTTADTTNEFHSTASNSVGELSTKSTASVLNDRGDSRRPELSLALISVPTDILEDSKHGSEQQNSSQLQTHQSNTLTLFAPRNTSLLPSLLSVSGAKSTAATNIFSMGSTASGVRREGRAYVRSDRGALKRKQDKTSAGTLDLKGRYFFHQHREGDDALLEKFVHKRVKTVSFGANSSVNAPVFSSSSAESATNSGGDTTSFTTATVAAEQSSTSNVASFAFNAPAIVTEKPSFTFGATTSDVTNNGSVSVTPSTTKPISSEVENASAIKSEAAAAAAAPSVDGNIVPVDTVNASTSVSGFGFPSFGQQTNVAPVVSVVATDSTGSGPSVPSNPFGAAFSFGSVSASSTKSVPDTTTFAPTAVVPVSFDLSGAGSFAAVQNQSRPPSAGKTKISPSTKDSVPSFGIAFSSESSSADSTTSGTNLFGSDTMVATSKQSPFTFGAAAPTSTAVIGTGTGFGFGSTNNMSAVPAFGVVAPESASFQPAFGFPTTTATTNTATAVPTGGGAFGGPFGGNNTATSTGVTASGGNATFSFGSTNPTTAPASFTFGGGNPVASNPFTATNTSSNIGGGFGFGQQQQQPVTLQQQTNPFGATSGFGMQSQSAPVNMFGGSSSGSGFGTAMPNAGGSFQFANPNAALQTNPAFGAMGSSGTTSDLSGGGMMFGAGTSGGSQQQAGRRKLRGKR